VHDERIAVRVSEFLHVSLKVRLGALVACAKAHGVVFKAVARRVELVQVRACRVDADDEEADAVWAFAILHCIQLRAVRECAHQARERQRTTVGKPRRERQLAHVGAV